MATAAKDKVAGEGLRDKLRAHLKDTQGIVEKRSFGGTGFMWRGNLLCGTMGDDLFVRIDPKQADAFVQDKGARFMEMAGKTSKRFIVVEQAAVRRAPSLRKWVGRAFAFVGTLPEK